MADARRATEIPVPQLHTDWSLERPAETPGADFHAQGSSRHFSTDKGGAAKGQYNASVGTYYSYDGSNAASQGANQNNSGSSSSSSWQPLFPQLQGLNFGKQTATADATRLDMRIPTTRLYPDAAQMSTSSYHQPGAPLTSIPEGSQEFNTSPQSTAQEPSSWWSRLNPFGLRAPLATNPP